MDFILGQSSRTESSNQLDTHEENLNSVGAQNCYSQSLLQLSNIPVKHNSEDRMMSSTEESSSCQSSGEEDQSSKAQQDHCHEPIFVKVYIQVANEGKV